MHVGLDHPIFGQRSPPSGSGGEIFGGPRPLPRYEHTLLIRKFFFKISNLMLYYRGSVPPGARFDPIGPFRPSGPNPNRPRGRGGYFR